MSTRKYDASVEDTTHTGGLIRVIINAEGNRFASTARNNHESGWWIGLSDDEAVRLISILGETMNRDAKLKATMALAKQASEMEEE